MILVIDIGNTTIAFTGLFNSRPGKEGVEKTGKEQIDREKAGREQINREKVGVERTGKEQFDREKAGMEKTGKEQFDRDKAGAAPTDLQVLFEKKLPTSSGRDVETFIREAEDLLRGLLCLPDVPVSSGDRPVCLRENRGHAAEEDALPASSRNTPSCRAEDEGSAVAAGAPSAAFPDVVDLVSISSVVPACTPAAVALAGKLCSLPPVVISCRCDTGLSFDRLPAPEKVGADRIADAAWAAAAYPLPAMTVDLGTATTINVVGAPETDPADAECTRGTDPLVHFLGGMIGAGVRTSLQALRTGTAQLPALDPGPVLRENLIGRDTDGCMLSAAVVGTASMIEGLAERVEEVLGAGSLSLILTGGNAGPVAEWIRRKHDYEPALAAKGAALIALRQTQQL